MNMAFLLKNLPKHGFAVRKYSHGDESVDGDIDITDNISIQVPFPEGNPCVVVRSLSPERPQSPEFEFFQERRYFNGLVRDLHAALARSSS